VVEVEVEVEVEVGVGVGVGVEVGVEVAVVVVVAVVVAVAALAAVTVAAVVEVEAAECQEPVRGTAQSCSSRCCSRSRPCSPWGRGSSARKRRSRTSKRCSSSQS
jgi:hypothetical protein